MKLRKFMSKNGIPNIFLEKYLKNAKIPFDGVFSINKIPEKIWRKKYFSFIFNTSPDIVPVGHFVTVIKTKYHVLYLDTLALNQHSNFIEHKCKYKVLTLRRPIQDEQSMHCGFYSMLFILYNHFKPPFMLQFTENPNNLYTNDSKCMMYLDRIRQQYLK